MTDYYDGPRKGIADFNGRPHLYISEWDEDPDHHAPTFLLSPVDDGTLAIAMEDWSIWRRWETAFYEGRTPPDTHPALPDDRRRHEELQPLLAERLVLDPQKCVRARADFRPREDPTWSGLGFASLEVSWQPA